jgi:nicotinamide-nucleotide amidase
MIRESFPDAIYAETDGREAPIERVVGDLLRERNQWLATAESCTGGLIAHRLTQIAGSSDYFRGGIVAYDNHVKTDLLGVPADLLAAHGAVSESVARAMAEGVRQRLNAGYGLATTGIAGPGGGTVEKPVGLVFMAVADANRTVVREVRTGGDREYIKQWASQTALNLLRLRMADRI